MQSWHNQRPQLLEKVHPHTHPESSGWGLRSQVQGAAKGWHGPRPLWTYSLATGDTFTVLPVVRKTSSSSCIEVGWERHIVFLNYLFFENFIQHVFIIFSHPPFPFRFYLQTSYYFSLLKIQTNKTGKKQNILKKLGVQWTHIRPAQAQAGRNPSKGVGKWAQSSIPYKNCLQVLSAQTGEICCLKWIDTGCVNYTPGQAPCPGEVCQHKLETFSPWPSPDTQKLRPQCLFLVGYLTQFMLKFSI